MATNKKISELTEFTAAQMADDDLIVMVDVSDSTTKKVQASTFRATVSGVSTLSADSPLSVDAATGDVTMSLGTVAVAKGGTGATDAATARTNLGLGSIATQDSTSVNIDGGAIDGTTVGATTQSTGSFSSLTIGSATAVTDVDTDLTTVSASDNTLASAKAIKTYVDSQVGTVDTLSEILSNGNTTGANNIIVTAGQSVTTDTISETTAASGVTVDSLLIKDGGITAAGTSTFAGQTITNLGTVTTADINGGTIDGTTIGGSSAAAGTFTNVTATGTINLSGATVSNGGSVTTVDINGGTIDGTTIGGSSAAPGTFTTFTSTGIDDNATSTAVTINSSQNVGIGTTDTSLFNSVGTSATLTVAGSSTNTTTTANGVAAINIVQTNGTAGNTAGLHFSRQDTDGTPNYSGAAIVAQFPDTQATSQYPKGLLAFNTSTATGFAPSEKMRIDSSGNVGIGTSSPAFQQIAKGIEIETGDNVGYRAETTGVNASVVELFSGSFAGTAGGSLSTIGSYPLMFGTNTTERMRITSSGYVGIGETSVSNPLHVKGGDNTLSTIIIDDTATGGGRKWGLRPGVSGVSNGYFAIYDETATAARLVITESGNVGIGASSPGYLLDVAGNARLNATSNPVLLFSEAGTWRGLITSSSSLGLAFETNGALPLYFNTNSTERMRIDGSGNVGIGTSSPSYNLDIQKPNPATINLYCTDAAPSYLRLSASGQTIWRIGQSLTVGSALQFYDETNSASRMMIDSSGQVFINTTTDALTGKLQVHFDGLIQQGITIKNTANSANGAAVRFVDYTGASTGGGIYYTSSNSITYATSSDYRLKENVVATIGAVEKVKQLNPVNFNFIGESESVDGFLAHELQTVVPNSVIGEKDAVTNSGENKYQVADYAKLVPLLTAALKEAVEKIEILEARVASLEAN